MTVNYRTEAIKELLNKDCVLNRYYDLLPLRDSLVYFYISKNCVTKEQCLSLRDEEVLQAGLLKQTELLLLKRFLSMYDIPSAKLREIDGLPLSEEERAAYKELYLLPGVKSTRAALYYKSGIKALREIAALTSQNIIDRTTETIRKYSLCCKAPLPKEANTHIAVARAFTIYRAD